MEQTTFVTAQAATRQCLLDALSRIPGRERQLLLLLADKLNRQGGPPGPAVKVQAAELEPLLDQAATAKTGLYLEQIGALLAGIGSRKIQLTRAQEGTGVQLPPGHLYWLSGIDPHYDEHGILCVRFFLTPFVIPFLQEFQSSHSPEDWHEMNRLKSLPAMRLCQLCLSFRKQERQDDVLAVTLEALKEHLGVADKHGDFRNFRQKVLVPARDEINACTSLNIAFDFVRSGRQISEVRIFMHRKTADDPGGFLQKAGRRAAKATKAANPPALGQPGEEGGGNTTAATERAFETLAARGISARTILGELFPSIKGSEVLGHEDLFVLLLLDHFDKKIAPRYREHGTAALRRWLSGRPLEDPSLFARIMEQLVARKKSIRASKYR